MKHNKVMLLISDTVKKYLMLIPILILVTIFISAVIFANSEHNPLEGKSIIIDPGHGGIDPGTNDGGSFLEKDVNLAIAKKLKAALEAKKARVTLTRDTDIALDNRNSLSSSRHRRDLLERVNMFNSGKFDIFISIHVNRSSSSRAIGPLVIYETTFPSTGVLADCIQINLNGHMKENLKVDINRKPVVSDFFILEYAQIPGVIVETGYISNPSEKYMLKDDAYQSKLARSISTGISDYFEAMETLDDPDAETDAPKLPAPYEEDNVPSNMMDDVQFVYRHE